jgi:hypothetical protein
MIGGLDLCPLGLGGLRSSYPQPVVSSSTLVTSRGGTLNLPRITRIMEMAIAFSARGDRPICC